MFNNMIKTHQIIKAIQNKIVYINIRGKLDRDEDKNENGPHSPLPRVNKDSLLCSGSCRKKKSL